MNILKYKGKKMDVYPPEILNRFMSLSNIIPGRENKMGEHFKGIDALREMLEDEIIWYAKPAEFNDPFEFQNYKCVGLNGERLPDDQINRLNHPDGGGVLSKTGILCFCASGTDIRMWSHYADSHKGICIRFKCEKDPFYDTRLYDVTYDDNITEFIMDTENIDRVPILKQVSTKAECWQYEEEYRVINVSSGIDSSDGHGLKDFPTKLIEGIVFGVKTSEENKKEIYDIIKAVPHEISLYQAKQIDDYLKLKIKRIED